MVKKTNWVLIAIFTVAVIVPVWTLVSTRLSLERHTNSQDQLNILASFYPLQYLANQVGKGRVSVVSLTPAGVEPHDYEPATSDLKMVSDADLTLVLGGGFEPWSKDVKNPKVVEIGTRYMGEALDPHVWLDPIKVMEMARDIEAQFVKLDPAGANVYSENLLSLITTLDKLDTDYRQGLRQCKGRDMVVSHAAFGYLAERYGLEQIAISGISPEEEPSPGRIAEIVREVKTKGVQTIFAEPFIGEGLTNTLAQEVGVNVHKLNPVEALYADQIESGESYVTIMYANLESLRTGLGCD